MEFFLFYGLAIDKKIIHLEANVYREERNIVDLYIILLRFSSLVSETIPLHRDYPALHPREKTRYKKKLLNVLDELEALKPEFQQRVEELNKDDAGLQLVGLDSQERRTGYTSDTASVDWSSAAGSSFSSMDKRPAGTASSSLWRYRNDHSQILSSNPAQLDKQFQKISLSLPAPRQETLSRHSILGPNGLRSQWRGPSADIKVHYPSSLDFTPKEESCNSLGQPEAVAIRDAGQGAAITAMESVLSLDDGKWSHPAEESLPALINEVQEDPFKLVSIKQPSPPPVLARLQQGSAPIPPSQVADPRPGPAKPFQHTPDSYQHLHVPVNMMEDFLRLARANTAKNLETCGVLAGSLKNRVFHITTLIIPKQESTSDSCQTLNEEEIFEIQDRLSLFPLGWIHTHPSQTCFMSSVDLHTHYSYQIMLPEAVAIVMAPTDTSSPHGIFHLSDPSGVNVIRNCQERGFHPHEEASDGSPIYEHCSHVYMNSKLKFEIVDLR
ncbi:AMSH-like ubiquitin thioesterase 3 [Punica granatum]|uniref:AMSH-like ubiquitin thioesterase 3 n=1 Tax=Punica granatum TaxID=22663 RepID=A0A6P8DQV2_PUNGR|nr:AMSH-like ubiquitin thioesterase 3 [Punica granatum]